MPDSFLVSLNEIKTLGHKNKFDFHGENLLTE